MLRYFFLHRAALWGCLREFVSKLLPCEKGVLKSPQAFQNPKLKLYFPLNMRKANAARIPNRSLKAVTSQRGVSSPALPSG